MKKLNTLSIFFLTLLFSYTIVAQQMRSLRSVNKINIPKKIQKLVTDPLPAGTYTIGTAGDFPTIDSAFNKLSVDGITGSVILELIDTLYISPTTENGFTLNGPIPGTGVNNRVILKPADNKNITIEGNGMYVMSFFNINYFTLDGVSINGSTSLTFHSLFNSQFNKNRAVEILDNSNFNIIQNLTFIGEDIYRYGDGILVGASLNSLFAPDSNIIQNNFIKKCGGSIVVGVVSSSNVRPTGNIVRNNIIGSETDSLISWGIELDKCRNSLVENNIIQNMKVTTTYGNDILIMGINCYDGSGDIIRNNIVHNIKSSAGYTSTGILLSGSSGEVGNNNTVYNNMVYDIQSTSTASNNRVTGIQMWNQNNPKVYYNSVYLTGEGSNNYGISGIIYS